MSFNEVSGEAAGALEHWSTGALAHWCRTQGLDLICSRLESRAGTLTGRYREAQCIGEEKRRRIAEKYTLGDFDHVYAYGDTKDDMEMLGMAHTKFFRGQEMA